MSITPISLNFLETNWFLKYGKNMSDFVTNDVIHYAFEGPLPEVVKNPSYPLVVSTRVDTPDFATLHNYSTKPTRVFYDETIELVYNKRESILAGHRTALLNEISTEGMWNVGPKQNTAKTPIISGTTGAVVNGYKTILKEDIKKLRVALDTKYPDKRGMQWVLVLDDECFWELVANDPNLNAQIQNNNPVGDVNIGTSFKYYGFIVFADSRTPWYAAGVKKAYGSTPVLGTDLPSAIAFLNQESFMIAQGSTEMFADEKNPEWQADLWSFQTRAMVEPFGTVSNNELHLGALLRTPA